ncbi:large conductance mechanosensitive channel [Rubricella aquisinus]|uniref:Large-conductance mechanosensitive channel n=1 Tax=Rubricella aquisinus TaxID=2028108 RepID=A0A840WMX6_9RHOB|nr:large conductance mechanosensitive channel protein MscL [Rubricella aquisinus]MBB5515012.1 large conductance mechanosensitive channel [Rubricella aquisinus]
MLEEFKKFALKGNVMDMAVGIIIGAAFTTIVKSLVTDIITPIIGYISGGVDFTNVFTVLGEGDFATLAAAQEAGAATINWGIFLNAVFAFLIVAWVLFLVVRTMNKAKEAMEKKEEPAPEAPKGPTQEELLSDIRDLLKAQQG